jgi:hypothetical protein
MGQSMYFKRCNGEYINGVGQVLQETMNERTKFEEERETGNNEEVEDEDGAGTGPRGVGTEKMLDYEKQTASATNHPFTPERLAKVMWRYNRESGREDVWSGSDDSEDESEGLDAEE